MDGKETLEQKRSQWTHETEVYLSEKLGQAWPHDTLFKPKVRSDTVRAGQSRVAYASKPAERIPGRIGVRLSKA